MLLWSHDTGFAPLLDTEANSDLKVLGDPDMRDIINL